VSEAPDEADAPQPAPAPISTPPVIEVPPLRVADATPISVEPEGLPSDGMAHEVLEDDDANPTEVRRQIAAARRNMDPDHQIRRAMDAFLSPTKPNGDGS
jgi:hypothetical protein